MSRASSSKRASISSSPPSPRAIASSSLSPPVHHPSAVETRIQSVVWGGTHVRANAALNTSKTTITQEAADSIRAHAGSAIDAGTHKFGGAVNNMSLVPRRSNPDELRLVGTHTSGGNGHTFTSFPVDNADAIKAAQAFAPHGKTVKHVPDTPPLSPRAAHGSAPPLLDI